jgi:hypothetical protein
MNRNFVPLSVGRPTLAPPPPPGTPPGKPATETGAASAPVFRPLNAAPDGCAGSPLPGEPKITLERDGERVTRITIQCACGRTIELACAY